ncbi:MAG TPA: hypothetical protein VFW88_07040 [Burkholderiales bacterium]|nr:hypothetical protein [Burkholderiales bacterium]
MANYFDQFDQAQATPPLPPVLAAITKPKNYFDQFDAPEPVTPKPTPLAKEPMAPLGTVMGAQAADMAAFRHGAEAEPEPSTVGKDIYATELGLGSIVPDFLSLPLMASAGAARGINALRGDTAATDTLFPTIKALNDQGAAMRSQAQALSPTAADLGNLGGMLLEFAGGGGAKLGKTGAEAIEKGVSKLARSPYGQQLLQRLFTHAATNLPTAATLSAQGANADAAAMTNANVPLDQIEKAFGTNAALGTLAFDAPVAMPGRALVRAITGEGIGLGLSAAQQEAGHAVAPEGVAAPTLPDFSKPTTYLPAALALLMGERGVPRSRITTTAEVETALRKAGVSEADIEAAKKGTDPAPQPYTVDNLGQPENITLAASPEQQAADAFMQQLPQTEVKSSATDAGAATGGEGQIPPGSPPEAVTPIYKESPTNTAQQPATIQTPHGVATSDFSAKAKEQGLNDAQIAALAPKDVRDPVTGFYGASDRLPTLKRAQDFVLQTGQPGVYVEADLKNLGGVNATLGHTEANRQVYTPFAKLFQQNLEATGGQVIPFKHGGDEVSAVVVGADPKNVQAALTKTEQQAQVLGEKAGLGDVPHPKYSGVKGTGLYTGMAEIHPGTPVEDIPKQVDTDIEKVKGQSNVNRSPFATAGAVASGERPGGAPEGVGRNDSAATAENTGGTGAPEPPTAGEPTLERDTAAPDQEVATGGKFSRRIFRNDRRGPANFVVPETPEFAGNMTGDLSRFPDTAAKRGIKPLPIRLPVGAVREDHRGFGVEHMAENGDAYPAREPPQYTDNRAENYARHVAAIARSGTEGYIEGNRVILRSPRMGEALVLQEREDANGPYYGVVTFLPAQKSRWGVPAWTGRSQAPVATPQSRAASVPPPGQNELRPDRLSPEAQTEHYDLPPKDEPSQVGKRSVGAAGNHSVESLREGLKTSLGPLADRLERAKLLKLHETAQDIPGVRPSEAEGVQGYFDGKTAHLAADGIAPGNEVGVLLHEATHASADGTGDLKTILGVRYAPLIKQLHMLMDAGDERVAKARLRVPEDTPAEHHDEEWLSYLIEDVTNTEANKRAATFGEKVMQLYHRVVHALRAWVTASPLAARAHRFGIDLNLKPEDLVALARRAAHKWADTAEREAKAPEGEPQPAFSQDVGKLPSQEDAIYNHAKELDMDESLASDVSLTSGARRVEKALDTPGAKLRYMKTDETVTVLEPAREFNHGLKGGLPDKEWRVLVRRENGDEQWLPTSEMWTPKANGGKFSRAAEADLETEHGTPDETELPPRAPGESQSAYHARVIRESREPMINGIKQAIGLDTPTAEQVTQRKIGRGELKYMWASLQRAQDKAAAAFSAAMKVFDKAGKQANLDAIHQWETGQPVTSAAHRLFFAAMDKGFNERIDEIQRLAPDSMEHLIEHYFPHLWEDPTKAANWYQSMSAKRPLAGNKAFLKQRVHDTIRDGMEAGLKPISTNPVDLVLAKMAQMDKFIALNRFRKDLNDRGWLKKMEAGERVPFGYARVDDAAFERARGLQGYYAVPEGIARDINNYLSPSLYRFKGFKALRKVQNLVMMARLGWSAFHAGFTTYDNVVMHADVAGRYLLRGDIKNGLVTLAKAPLSIVYSPFEGGKLNRQWLGLDKADANTAALLDALEQGGAHYKMSSSDYNNDLPKFLRSLRQQDYGKSLKTSLSALGETGSWLIHHKLVPNQKMSARLLLAKFELDRVAGKLGKESGDYAGIIDAMHPDVLKQIMGRVVNNVDDRLGQMNYDNQFWNKTAREIAQTAIGALGWQVGTVRTVTGGVRDIAHLWAPEKLLSSLDKEGKINDADMGRVSGRLTYFLSLALIMGGTSAITQYLMTGKGPDELEDYFFPKTGRLNADGSAERLQFPTYWSDHYKLATHPLLTMEHKIHPTIGMFMEALSNQDYYGTQIREPYAPWYKQAEQVGEYLAKGFTPYAITNTAKAHQNDAGLGREAASFVGVTTAPASVSRTPFQEFVANKAYESEPQAARTQAQAEHSQRMHAVEVALRSGDSPDMSDLTPRDQRNAKRASSMEVPEIRFKRLSFEDKLHAWKVATPAERDRYHLRDMILRSNWREALNRLPDEERGPLMMRLRAISEDNHG